MTREDGEKILNSVLQMSLYMLMGKELMEVIYKMVERADLDISLKAGKALAGSPVIEKVDQVLYLLSQRKDKELRDMLQKYLWETRLGKNTMERPQVIRKAPDNWSDYADVYSFGWERQADNRAAVAKIMAASVKSA